MGMVIIRLIETIRSEILTLLMDPPKGFIYKITCTITEKVYIGQTSTSVESRFKKHLEKAKVFTEEGKKASCRHLYRAMKLYGIDNFIVETIAEIPYVKEELDALEEQLISEYDSVRGGYNLLSGGTSGGKHA
jgi:group I intron endonuclease